MARRRSELLTSVELEFMKVLWDLGQGSVRDVMAAMTAPDAGAEAGARAGAGARAYSSVATVLKILDQKGYVTARTEGRALIYAPAVRRAAYEARSLRSLSRNLFDDAPAALVARLVDDEALDRAEIDAIRRVIDARLGRDDAVRPAAKRGVGGTSDG